MVGGGSQMYRLNLEQGRSVDLDHFKSCIKSQVIRFLNSLDTGAPSINCLALNPEHGLVCGGTADGRVTCWDPRSVFKITKTRLNCSSRDRTLAGTLDVAMRCQVNLTEGGDGQVAAVTAITQRNGLNLGVGTSTGQVEYYGSLADSLTVCIPFLSHRSYCMICDPVSLC